MGDSSHMLNDCIVSQTTCEMSLKLLWTLFDYVMACEMYKFSPLFVLQVMKSWAGPWNEITERLQDTISRSEKLRELCCPVGDNMYRCLST